jgi:hypothetical protein
MRLLALSVDLDEIPCYTAIHGLPTPGGDAARAIYLHAVPRFEALFAQLGAPATFFAVGHDLSEPHAREAIARLARGGHEIGNHSFHHRYDLTRRAPDAMREDVARGAAAIEAITGSAPLGFRAPGYTVTDALLAEVAAAGALYDSSVFPCPPYYAAKALAIGAIALRGRKSRSILDDPRVLAAPADPYRIGAHYRERGAGLLELPIGVTSDLSGRLPFIGTTLSMLGPRMARTLARRIVGRPLVNLELHGIDLSDAQADGLAFLAPHQSDLRLSLERKRDALMAVVSELRDAGYELVTLAQAAQRLKD